MAVPVLSLVACGGSSRDGSGFQKAEENTGENAASTGDDGTSGDTGNAISGSDAGKKDPVADGSEIDLAAVEPCDADLDVDANAAAFLKAIGLCKMADEDSEEWGVIDAKFVANVGSDDGDPGDGQHGILPKFGDTLTAREGANLGVLSTGWAREYDSENGSSTHFRPGTSLGDFSFDGSSVPSEFNDQTPMDLINFRVRIRVPKNAKSFSFDFNFHSSEWPEFVSSDKNDKFIAYLTDSNNPDGANISFDSEGNAVSVNLTGELFDRCVPDAKVGCSGETASTSVCGAGPEELEGTGFGGTTSACGTSQSGWGGATGWLTTSAPVVPGDIITLEFAVWDADDSIYDSLVLLDNFKWDANPATTQTTRPPN